MVGRDNHLTVRDVDSAAASCATSGISGTNRRVGRHDWLSRQDLLAGPVEFDDLTTCRKRSLSNDGGKIDMHIAASMKTRNT